MEPTFFLCVFVPALPVIIINAMLAHAAFELAQRRRGEEDSTWRYLCIHHLEPFFTTGWCMVWFLSNGSDTVGREQPWVQAVVLTLPMIMLLAPVAGIRTYNPILRRENQRTLLLGLGRYACTFVIWFSTFDVSMVSLGALALLSGLGLFIGCMIRTWSLVKAARQGPLSVRP